MTALLLLSALLTTAPSGDEVDNPDYASWAGFQPGAWVKIHEKGRKASISDGNVTLSTPELSPFDEAEFTWKLVEVTRDQIILEASGWTLSGGQKKEVSGKRREIPAKVKKSPDTPPVRGNEDLRIGEKVLPCLWEDRILGAPRQSVGGNRWEGKTVARSWRNATIPGGLVKELTEARGPRGVGQETRLVTVLEWSGSLETATTPRKPQR